MNIRQAQREQYISNLKINKDFDGRELAEGIIILIEKKQKIVIYVELFMNEFEYHLVENELNAKDFIRLKVATGFRDRPIEQVERALRNNLFDVTAIYNGEVIGMGRLVGDGVMYWYLQEIIVLPQYQGQGIGTKIVKRLLEYIKENTMPGTFVSVGLTAAKGKDTFYEKFGFSKSIGMTRYIER